LFLDIGNLDSIKKVSPSHSTVITITDFPTDIVCAWIYQELNYPSLPSEEENEDESWKKSILAKRTRTILFDNYSPKISTGRPNLLVSPNPTSKIAHLIFTIVDDLEEEKRSPGETEMNQPAVHSEKDKS